jgi:small membrane protein
MVASVLLSMLLLGTLVYAWSEQRRAPLVATSTIGVVICGLYLVWFPSQANMLAELAGVGRGADLILYLWVLISLLIVFNLHLKLRAHLELITDLAREIALLQARLKKQEQPLGRRDSSMSGEDRQG